MQNGFGSIRRKVMYNDFVVVGPKDDPAKVGATHDAVAALRKIAAAKARFVSRGDMSGTDAAEQRLWTEAGGRPIAARDLWYVKTGSSMEQTLTTAASINGYALTDRGTWAQFRDRRNLKIVVDHDARLFNQYCLAGELGTASPSEGRYGHGVHRMAHLARGSRQNRKLQSRR